MNLIEFHKNQLESFCKDNGFSFDKLKALPRCGNESALYIQTYDAASVGKGLNNNTPAEILVSLETDRNGKTIITKGKNADKYLKQ